MDIRKFFKKREKKHGDETPARKDSGNVSSTKQAETVDDSAPLEAENDSVDDPGKLSS